MEFNVFFFFVFPSHFRPEAAVCIVVDFGLFVNIGVYNSCSIFHVPGDLEGVSK